MKEHILWDLDGTLTNPRLGITRCIQYALKQQDLPILSEQDLIWCIGPPLDDSFSILAPHLSKDEISKLVQSYRERFESLGMFENEIYPEIPWLLNALSHKKMYVATSKPHIYAKQIISHFQLASHFVCIYGSELSGERSDKADLIQFILSSEKIDPSDVVIVGDRKYDVLGARKAEISSIAVTWGYGSKAELKAANPDWIVDSAAELKELLLS